MNRAWLLRLILAICVIAYGQNAFSDDDDPPAGKKSQPEASQPEASKSETPEPETEAPARLPWEKNAKRGPAGLQGFRNAREMLKYLGVESSEFEAFFQNEPLTPAEEDVLFKLLYLFPRLGLEDLHRWRKDQVDWEAVLQKPDDFRGEIFRLRGRAKSLKQMPLIAEVVDRYEFDHYYRIELELPDSPVRALICSRTAPSNWPQDSPIDEPISVDAMFLKLGEKVEESQQAIFAAQRVRWHPEQENKQLAVGTTEVGLAKLGFDVGLLSDLSQANYQGLGPLDREPFYGLLAALEKAAPGDTAGQRFDEPALVELLESKSLPHGKAFRVKGNGRKIVRVRVDDPDIRERYGLDHYYQVDFFIPLEKAIKFGKDKKGAAAPVYANGYPATICLLELPPGAKEGDNLRQAFESDAIFYKLWSYPKGNAHKVTERQVAPMFLARTLMTVDNSTAPVLTLTDVLVAVGLVGALVLFGVGLWWAGSRKKPGTGAELVTGSTPVHVSLPEDMRSP